MRLAKASTCRPSAPSYTFDPSRVSKDPTDRTALVTYGHPGLDALLTAISPIADGVPAIVRHEREGIVAYARADLSPPSLVGSCEDLAPLGEPVAHGDAQVLAARAVDEELAEPRRRRNEAAAMRQMRVLEQRRSEFVAAVRLGLTARVHLLRDATGVEPGPAATLEGLEDLMPAWMPVDAVAQRLKVPIARDPAADRRGGKRRLERRAHQGDQRLMALYAEVAGAVAMVGVQPESRVLATCR